MTEAELKKMRHYFIDRSDGRVLAVFSSAPNPGSDWHKRGLLLAVSDQKLTQDHTCSWARQEVEDTDPPAQVNVITASQYVPRPEVIAAKEATQYLRDRAKEYPLMEDQLDAIWKQLNYDRLQGKQLIQEADDRLNEILAVKAKYPKPD